MLQNISIKEIFWWVRKNFDLLFRLAIAWKRRVSVWNWRTGLERVVERLIDGVWECFISIISNLFFSFRLCFPNSFPLAMLMILFILFHRVKTSGYEDLEEHLSSFEGVLNFYNLKFLLYEIQVYKKMSLKNWCHIDRGIPLNDGNFSALWIGACCEDPWWHRLPRQ